MSTVSWLRTIQARFYSLFRREKLDAEMDEEIRSHIELQARANLAAGMNPKQARLAAIHQFGSTESIKEFCREQRGWPWLDELLQDLRFGTRMLAKNKAMSLVIILTLGLGIGANTAIFSVIDSVLLRPLPYHDPARLVAVSESNLKRGYRQIVVAPGNLRDWCEQNSVFEQLGGQIYTSLTLSGVETPQHLQAAWTTPNFFSIFGVPPFLGRTFGAGDKPPAGHRVVVLSYGLWQQAFAANRDVLGKPITLSGLIYTVVGVMPKEFEIFNPPALFGLPTGRAQPQLWAPYPGSMDERTNRYFEGFGRLKPGVTLAQAQTEIQSIFERTKREFPAQQDWGACVMSLREQILGNTRPVLRLLLGAVLFVLLIACTNVANLSLARAVRRGREFAVRSALGARRGRLVRQVLVESMMLSLLGGAAGVLLAQAGLVGLRSLQPQNLPRLNEVRLDIAVLAVTLVVSIATGLFFGLAPALACSRRDINRSLTQGAPGTGEASGPQHTRIALVIGEVALATILLAGAGLMLNSFARLTHVHPGFQPEQLMTFDVSPAGRGYAEDAKRMRLVGELRRTIGAQAGVKSVAAVYGLPFGSMLNSLVRVNVEGGLPSDPHEQASAGWRVVSPNYFTTMGIPLAAGRAFSEDLDRSDSPPVAIVNEAFARKYFHEEDPLGRRIQIVTISTNWHEIVGVIQDVKLTGLAAPATPEIYQSGSQHAVWMFSLVVRSALPPAQVEKLVRAQAATVDKDLPLFNVHTMSQAIGTSVASPRFLIILVGVFAGLAVSLTAVGIYGVVSYTVGQRTRELGIRMALGASRLEILGQVLGRGMRVALFGVAAGLAGSLALTRLLTGQLFEVSSTDPATFAAVVAFLVILLLAACYLPARRATKVDPMVCLRYE